MTRLSALLVLTLALLSAAAPAHAQPSPSVALAEIREMILYARYDEAIAAAQSFLEREGLAARDRNIGLEVLATAHLANRDQENADRVLGELYRRDPGHRLTDGDASPFVQAAFQRARERLPETIAVTLAHTPPSIEGRESPLIEVGVSEGVEAVQEVRLAYRTNDSPRFARLVMNLDEDGVARGRVPLVGAPNAAQTVQYFILALAPSGTPLAQVGDEAEPLELTIPPAVQDDVRAIAVPEEEDDEVDEGGSLWWVGLLVGIVAIGAGVGIGLALREDAPDGTLGNVSLR